MSFLKFQLRSGVHSRRVRIQATYDPGTVQLPEDVDGGFEPVRIDRVISAFLEGVRSGCLHFIPSQASAAAVLSQPEDVLRPGLLLWRVDFTALPEGAFQVLGNMAACSAERGSGISHFDIVEEGPLTPHASPSLPLKTLVAPAAPFPVRQDVRNQAKEFRVWISFAHSLSDMGLEAVRGALHAWENLAGNGAFPLEPSERFSAVRFLEIERHLAHEVVARGEFFFGGTEAWDALVRCLRHVELTSGKIARLEIG